MLRSPALAGDQAVGLLGAIEVEAVRRQRELEVELASPPPGDRGTRRGCGSPSSGRTGAGSRCRAPRSARRTGRARTSARASGLSSFLIEQASRGTSRRTLPTTTTLPRSRQILPGQLDRVVALRRGGQDDAIDAPPLGEHLDGALDAGVPGQGEVGARPARELHEVRRQVGGERPRQPAALRICTVSWPSRPSPTTATLSPSETSACRTPCSAIAPRVV